LRAKRAQIASGFTWLTIAMHAVLVALSAFIYSVFGTFSTLVDSLLPKDANSGALPTLPAFGLFGQTSGYMGMLHFMVITVILILTVANALSIHFVNGGHILKLFFYLALTSAISGAVLVLVPQVVNVIFTPMVR
jgi:archaellum biogenesis protein FlaJ (TadC family)